MADPPGTPHTHTARQAAMAARRAAARPARTALAGAPEVWFTDADTGITVQVPTATGEDHG